MTRFGFGKEEFARLARLMAECILHGENIKEEVARFRADYTEMRYCFGEAELDDALNTFAQATGI